LRKLIPLSELRIARGKLNKRNPRSFGVDGVNIAAFAANSESQLRKLLNNSQMVVTNSKAQKAF
jgi:hypothetical protein